jgi:hypothetical protein
VATGKACVIGQMFALDGKHIVKHRVLSVTITRLLGSAVL